MIFFVIFFAPFSPFGSGSSFFNRFLGGRFESGNSLSCAVPCLGLRSLGCPLFTNTGWCELWGLIRVWVFGCFPSGDGYVGEFVGMDDGWVLITNW
jgi:hypothetical protein